MNKVTAGRDQLDEFAPEFAHLNDDVLFGEVWERVKTLFKAKKYHYSDNIDCEWNHR